jgi:hypothetical protein
MLWQAFEHLRCPLVSAACQRYGRGMFGSGGVAERWVLLVSARVDWRVRW